MSQRPAPDLSVNKVLAGAGAAVTAAVIGSFFGVAGTVVGAAIGSVASTIATSLYERSLNTTRDRIRARLNAGGGVDVEERPEPPAPRPWARWAGVTAMVFLLGMLVVTGFEFVEGLEHRGHAGHVRRRGSRALVDGRRHPVGRPDDDGQGALDEGAHHAFGHADAVGDRRPHPLGHPHHHGSRRRARPRGERHGGLTRSRCT